MKVRLGDGLSPALCQVCQLLAANSQKFVEWCASVMVGFCASKMVGYLCLVRSGMHLIGELPQQEAARMGGSLRGSLLG